MLRMAHAPAGASTGLALGPTAPSTFPSGFSRAIPLRATPLLVVSFSTTTTFSSAAKTNFKSRDPFLQARPAAAAGPSRRFSNRRLCRVPLGRRWPQKRRLFHRRCALPPPAWLVVWRPATQSRLAPCRQPQARPAKGEQCPRARLRNDRQQPEGFQAPQVPWHHRRLALRATAARLKQVRFAVAAQTAGHPLPVRRPQRRIPSPHLQPSQAFTRNGRDHCHRRPRTLSWSPRQLSECARPRCFGPGRFPG